MQGRYRDSASAARLRAHPSVHARPRPQPAGLPRRRVERDLYWVIDAVYQSAFLDDDEGVSGGFMTTTSRTAAQPAPGAARRGFHPGIARSEEHTSELQSREKLVCRLLLEKKKQSSL